MATSRKSSISKKQTVKKSSRVTPSSKKLSSNSPLRRVLLFCAAFAVIGSIFLYITSAATTLKPLSVEVAAGEGSGLVASKKHAGVFWWMRDGGDSTASKPREAIYAIKFDSNGTPVAVRDGDKFPFYNISGFENNNWEDITADDDGNLWIGDIGANNCSRNNQRLLKVKEPDPSSSSTLSVVANYTFKFPDPASGCNTWNSEAMLWLDGKMYIFAKTSGSPVYRVDLPSGNSGTATLTRLGKFSDGVSNISVSSISTDRTRLMVASHGSMSVYKTSNPNLKGDELIKSFISTKAAYKSTIASGSDKKPSVEGGSFANGSRNIVLVGEGKQLYFAKPAAYGDTSSDSGSGGGSTADTTAPSVSITSPTNGSTVSGTITIGVSASDNVSVTAVNLFYDGTGVIREGTSQGDYGWGSRFDTARLADGVHTITAKAYDAAGNTSSSQVSVTVKNNTGDTTAPSVSITSPAANATVSGTITIDVSASDNTELASVNLYYDDTGIIREGTAQGNYGWGSRFDTEKLSNGTHTLSAVATDKAGNKKTAKITITVKN